MTPTPRQQVAPIAYILKMYPRFSETFILSEILELERQGVGVHIFSLKLPNDGRFHADVARVKAPVTYVPQSPINDFVKYLPALWKVLNWDRGLYLKLLWRTVRRRRWGAVKRFVQAGYIAPRLKAAGITHTHAHFATSATSVASYLNQLIGTTYSFTAHAKDIYIDSVAPDVLARKLQHARFVVTVSDFNQAHLSPMAGTTPIVRIYNGLDLQQFAVNGTQPDLEPPLILAVGRLIEKKGFDDLIRASALLRTEGRRFQCRIIGSGEDEAKLRDLVDKLDLQDLVQLPGPMPREQLIKLYPRASVFAAPCVIGADGNRDGLPTVLIEAMALGVPVVSTDVTGIPELVEHGKTGLLAPQHDAAGLAAAIGTLLDHPDHAQALARAGRARVEERFDLKQNAAHLRNLFEQVTYQ